MRQSRSYFARSKGRAFLLRLKDLFHTFKRLQGIEVCLNRALRRPGVVGHGFRRCRFVRPLTIWLARSSLILCINFRAEFFSSDPATILLMMRSRRRRQRDLIRALTEVLSNGSD